MNFNQLRDEAYDNAIRHGWHKQEYSGKHWIMLVISELAEAIQADRSDKRANKELYLSQVNDLVEITSEDVRPSISSYYFHEIISNTLEDEFADVVIRILDIAGLYNMDLNSLPYPFILRDSETETSLKSEIEKMTMTEFTFKCTEALIKSCNHGICKAHLQAVLHWVYLKTLTMGIDIEWFINQKMEYNKTRPYKHGKKY